ncbi:MAG: B12-binding domain-containing protein [Anaerolineaceae bacterium]
MSTSLDEIRKGIIEGDLAIVSSLVEQALQEKIEPHAILDVMTKAMSEVGRLFEEGEYYVPEMLVSARAMQNGLDILQPALTSADTKAKGKVIMGTVKGDLHDIGKNLVAILLRGAGYDVLDLGSDVAPEVFVQKVNNNGKCVVALSALLTTTMINMKAVIEAITAANLRKNVKIIVGGAPVTQEFANQIGADGYASDANKAVRLVDQLLAS